MEASRESRSALLSGDYGRSPARSTSRLAVSTTFGVHSFRGGATWARSGREGHRAGGSRTPHGPLTQRCPQKTLPKHSDLGLSGFHEKTNLHQARFFLDVSLPTPGGRQRNGRQNRDSGKPTPPPPPGSLDMNPRKVQSQHCDQKRSFGKFFSKRDHEFCPLECPRAVLIGSVALTQNEHSSTLR